MNTPIRWGMVVAYLLLTSASVLSQTRKGEPECPVGYDLLITDEKALCVAYASPVCSGGDSFDSDRGVCVSRERPECETGYSIDSKTGLCLIPEEQRCEPGFKQIVEEQVCVRYATATCPEGFATFDGSCFSQKETSCPEGYAWKATPQVTWPVTYFEGCRKDAPSTCPSGYTKASSFIAEYGGQCYQKVAANWYNNGMFSYPTGCPQAWPSYNLVNNECVRATTPTCPNGYHTYTFMGVTDCYLWAPLECPQDYLLDGQTEQCERVVPFNCPADYSYHANLGQCVEVAPLECSGMVVYDQNLANSIPTCFAMQEPACPDGYVPHADPLTCDRQMPPGCPLGYAFGADSYRCESVQTTTCPDGTRWNAESRTCSE